MSAEPYRVYWAPGCSSCLRTKEFLLSHDIEFESINVVETPEAMADIARIGYRSVPVVARGDEAVYCQDINDVAEFVGVSLVKTELTAEDFVVRIDLLLRAAQRFMCQLSTEQLDANFPGRDRPFRDLAYHIFMVPLGFLEAVRGGSLEMECFLRRPPAGAQTGAQIAELGEQIRVDFLVWWRSAKGKLPASVQTYYGERTAFSVLERTTWHAAQHCRQLQEVVRINGLSPDGPLGEAELDGLPLPEEIYDNEIALQ